MVFYSEGVSDSMTLDSVREATVTDRGLLARATFDNLNSNGPRFTLREVPGHSAVSPLLRWVAERRDFGLVAKRREGVTVAVVWTRYFTPQKTLAMGSLRTPFLS